MTSTESIVKAVHPWPTNAELVYDAYRLGYVRGNVYDVTPGAGGMWTRNLRNGMYYRDGIEWVGENLGRFDFTNLNFKSEVWDTVLYDPPYKLNGTPAMAGMDERYGIDVPTNEAKRLQLIDDGFTECARMLRSKGHLLVKCQDQVCSGRMVWQTDRLTKLATSLHLTKVDRFDMIGHSVPQPMNGRQQKHAHGRGSTLLVFRK